MTARYEEIARRLVHDVQHGRWARGDRLPTETQLSAEYGVSRGTMRSALDVVERLGMVSRRPRIGTVVESARPSGRFVRSISSLHDLVQYSDETRRDVLRVSGYVADEAAAADLECRPGQRWTRITMVRTAADETDEPICHTEVYLDPAIAEAVGDRLTDPHGLISEMVEQQTGQTSHTVEQRIRAQVVPASLAEVLQVPVGSAALQIRRRYLDQEGRPFEITVSTHPADRFDYVFTIHRGAD